MVNYFIIWALKNRIVVLFIAAEVLYSYGIMMSQTVVTVLMGLSSVNVAINAQLLKIKLA